MIIYSTFVSLSLQVWVKIIFILMSMGMARLDITSFISVAMRSPEPTIGLELASITKVSSSSTCQVNHLDTSLIFVGVLDLWCSRSSERTTILTVFCIIQVSIFIRTYLLLLDHKEASLSWSQHFRFASLVFFGNGKMDFLMLSNTTYLATFLQSKLRVYHWRNTCNMEVNFHLHCLVPIWFWSWSIYWINCELRSNLTLAMLEAIFS